MTSPTVPAVPDLVFTDPERLALASFLAGYRGLTRDAYALDPRPFFAWYDPPRVEAVHRPPGRHRPVRPGVEEAGRARATVARRLCTAAGFYRYAEEGLVPISPAVHVRRPRLDYEPHAVVDGAQDPPPRVIIVTTFDEDEHVFEALRGRASGFVLKDTPPEKAT